MIDINTEDSTWKTLTQFLRDEAAKRYEQLGYPGCEEREADMLRGEIRMIKTILNAPEPDQETPEAPVENLAYFQ